MKKKSQDAAEFLHAPSIPHEAQTLLSINNSGPSEDCKGRHNLLGCGQVCIVAAFLGGVG